MTMDNETTIGGKPEFAKYPKIPYINESADLLGREVYVFEKIDGSLSQIRRTENGILGGSKSNYITGSMQRPTWAQKFLKWMHSNNSLYKLKPGLIMFGEWLEPVTVEYDADRLDKFYFIDLAINTDKGILFYDHDEAVEYLTKWGIENVEILPPIQQNFLDQEMIGKIVEYERSALRTADKKVEKILLINQQPQDITAHAIRAEMEGVVLKNYNLQKFAKYLHPVYSEIREQEKELEKKYINLIRFNKAKRRLSDRGNFKFNLDELVEEIAKDIEEESGNHFEHSAVKGV